MMTRKVHKLSLNVQILLGAFAGIAGGLVVRGLPPDAGLPGLALTSCRVMGTVFLGLLKMVLIPLIFTSIAVGIANLRAHGRITRVWMTTVIFYLFTTVLSITLALAAVNFVKPGQGSDIAMFRDAMNVFDAKHLSPGQFLEQFISGLLMNPFKAMTENQVLPAVFLAILCGAAIVAMGTRAARLHAFLQEVFDLIMVLVGWIMRLAPLGVMALLWQLVATQDFSLFANLGKFAGLVTATTLFHGIVVLPAILWAVTGITPARFFIAMQDSLVTAFSTSSSSATMPVTLRCVEENLKVDKSISGFVVPIGTTMNMDGTAIYEATAAIFVANLCGIELTLGQQMIVFFTTMAAAIGAPGIPSAGMVTMIMVLQAVGLPAEAVAILIPIDRPLDTFRTVVNVEGDAIGSCVVQHLAGNPSTEK